MGWSFRKSTKFGPFRLNFSNSGIGFSFGVKGARIRSSSRGTFVNLGVSGLYYRQRIDKSSGNVLQPVTVQNEELLHTISSGDIDDLSDVDSKGIIEELETKYRKISYVTYLGFIPLVVILILFFAMVNVSSSPGRITWVSVWAILIIPLIGLWMTYLHSLDKTRKTVELFYTFDDERRALHDQLLESFSALMRCGRVWQKLHVQGVHDSKYASGASELVNRASIGGVSLSKLPSRFFVTNVSVPSISLRGIVFYFFPERLVLQRGKKFAAVSYKHLRVHGQDIQFIEEAALPFDAEVVDHTWKYVNKKGGPDKRFSNNYQIPICYYTDYTFESDSGLHEVITTSKRRTLDRFINTLQKLVV